MNRLFRTTALLLAIVWILGAGNSALAGPLQGDPASTHRVALGITAGEAGTAVVVPIYFTPAAETIVGYLKLEVNFVSRNLKFTRIERGIAAEIGNVDLQAEIQEEKNEEGLEISNLTIETSFSTPEPPAKGINSGLLGYLNFQINETAGPASITLRTSAEARELGTNRSIQNLSVSEGKVDVLAAGSAPAQVCFFFAH